MCFSEMFWTVVGSQPAIERANMDGSMRKSLIDSDLDEPVSIAVDIPGRLDIIM